MIPISISYIVNNSKLTLEEIHTKIVAVISDALDMTEVDIMNWIDRFVPFFNGDLISSLRPKIMKAMMEGQLDIQSSVGYADIVNAYSTAQVRHDIDPQAVGGFMPKLKLYLNTRIKINLLKAKRRHFGFQKGLGGLFQIIHVKK